jgi:hypothetical protein
MPTVKLDNNPLAFLFSFFSAILVLGFVLEIGSRIVFAFSPTAHTGFATIDSPLPPGGQDITGPYLPNQTLTFRQYAPNHSVNRTVTFKTNSLGWVSTYDYLPKKAGEFRVAILGDSLTASITNEKPWVDVVQSEMSADIATKNVLVMNLGIAASGFSQTAAYELPIAERLGADLVVLNFAFGTLDLPNLSAESRISMIQSGALEIPVQCTLRGNTCHPSLMLRTPHGYVPTSNELENARMASIAKNHLLRFLSLEGSAFIPRESKAAQSNREADAVKYIRTIKNGSPRLLLIVNPLSWKEPKLDDFLDRLIAAGFDIVDLRKMMPAATEAERQSWYNLPFDGHWSDKGAQIYGRLVAGVIRSRIGF